MDSVQMNLASLQSAISTVVMSKALNQDASTVTNLLQDMGETNQAILVKSAGSVGSQLDIRA